jgi:hypothetical protein
MGLEIKANKLRRKVDTDDTGTATLNFASTGANVSTGGGEHISLEDLTNITLMVIRQSLNRLYCLRSTSAQLSRAVMFGVSSKCAWMFILCRDFVKSSHSVSERILAYRIPHEKVLLYWMYISNVSQINNTWFLTPDGRHINVALLKMGVHPVTCITQLVKASIASHHRVYSISLPKLGCYQSYTLNRQIQCLTASPTYAEFCIKIVPEKCDVEVKTLKAVSAAFIANDCTTPFYAIAACNLNFVCEQTNNCNVNDTCDAASVLEAKLKSGDQFYDLPRSTVLNSPSFAWNYFGDLDTYSNVDDSGGAIVMWLGKYVNLDAADMELWVRGVSRTLLAAHKANVCQCDIRPSNVIMFGDNFQLIDFDLANTVDSSVTFVEGAQFDNRGYRLLSYNLGDSVQWQYADDYEMLLKLLVKR